MAKVWTRFEARRKDGSIVKLKIEDLPPDLHDQGFDFMTNYYAREEAFHVAAGVHKSKEALAEYRELLSVFYEKNPRRAIYCTLDNGENTNEIIGLSFMQLCGKEDKLKEFLKNFPVKSKELKLFYHNILTVVVEMFHDKTNFDRYYDGRGIIVHPDYRGLGIASQIVKVRKLICIDEKVPAMTAWMTSIGTQKAAEKNDCEVVSEISVEQLGKKTGLNFGNKILIFKQYISYIDC